MFAFADAYFRQCHILREQKRNVRDPLLSRTYGIDLCAWPALSLRAEICHSNFVRQRLNLLFFCFLMSLWTLGAQAQTGTRLLVLDGAATVPELNTQGRLLGETMLNALRGKKGVLVAKSAQVEAQAPLVGERLAGCDEELCLYEAATAIEAAYALFGVVSPKGEGVVLRLGLFENASGEILLQESIEGESVSAAIAPIQGALERVLAPVFDACVPKFFEKQTFTLGTGLAILGTTAAIGGLGWGLEMELALSDPARHRDQKAFALENGYKAWWFAGFGLATAAVGTALLTTAFFE